MKSWCSGALLAAGMLLCAVAAACGGGGGGGGELSLEQYFDQVGSIVAGLEERTATLDQPLEQEFDSEAEQIEEFRGTFAAVLPLFQDFVDDLDDLDPPAEVADAHGELVAGFADLMGDLEDLIDQLSEVESMAEFSELLLGPDSGFGWRSDSLQPSAFSYRALRMTTTSKPIFWSARVSPASGSVLPGLGSGPLTRSYL